MQQKVPSVHVWHLSGDTSRQGCSEIRKSEWTLKKNYTVRIGKLTLWRNRNLAKSQFGEIAIWRNRNLAKSQFGKITIWQICDLANIHEFDVKKHFTNQNALAHRYPPMKIKTVRYI